MKTMNMEVRKMSSMMNNIAKGIGAGVLAGLAVGAAGTLLMNSRSSHVRRSGKRAVHAMEDLVDNVAGMMR
jgi:gas vesicle protein